MHVQHFCMIFYLGCEKWINPYLYNCSNYWKDQVWFGRLWLKDSLQVLCFYHTSQCSRRHREDMEFPCWQGEWAAQLLSTKSSVAFNHILFWKTRGVEDVGTLKRMFFVVFSIILWLEINPYSVVLNKTKNPNSVTQGIGWLEAQT